jgi:hypothetical protein
MIVRNSPPRSQARNAISILSAFGCRRHTGKQSLLYCCCGAPTASNTENERTELLHAINTT